MPKRLFLGLLMASCVPCVEAGAGRIPIYEPTMITEPGTYLLTRNLSGPGPLISVQNTAKVEIDLNGFALEAEGLENALLIREAQLVFVHGGFLEGGGNTVGMNNARGVRLEGLVIRNSGSHGLFSEGSTGLVLRELLVEGPGGVGIRVEAGALTSTPVVDIVDSQVFGANDEGILLSSVQASTIARNTVSNSGGAGIYVVNARGVLVEANEVRGGESSGLDLSLDGSRVVGNVVHLAGSEGIGIRGKFNEVARNVVSDGAGAGISVTGDRNVLEANVLGGNASFGLHLTSSASSNVLRANTARGNAGSGCPDPGGTVDFCDEASNASAGDNFLPGLY